MEYVTIYWSRTARFIFLYNFLAKEFLPDKYKHKTLTEMFVLFHVESSHYFKMLTIIRNYQ